MHRGYKSMMDVVAERLEVIVVVAESLLCGGLSFSIPEAIAQLCLVCPHSHRMEKAMAPHSITLAWKIPWMEEPGGLQSTGSHRVGHN